MAFSLPRICSHGEVLQGVAGGNSSELEMICSVSPNDSCLLTLLL